MEQNHCESLMTGLEDAVAYINGDKSHGREVVREIPDMVPVYKATDVVRVRKALNLSQRRLALALGVSPRKEELSCFIHSKMPYLCGFVSFAIN